MNTTDYKQQVDLLLSALPLVAKENCFALHGGTAINLFISNMYRLSVDVDLTYLPIEDRVTSMSNINAALNRIAQNIRAFLPGVFVMHRHQEVKLIISNRDVSIKIEVNIIKRGCFSAPKIRSLCEKAQQVFGVFCEMTVVDNAHLFGGKVCAALDRQHPRDLFDIRLMFELQNFDNDLKKGFIFYLVSSNRPIVEILFPNLKNQKHIFNNQFAGMTYETFSYEDFENTRAILIQKIHALLTPEDKKFLMSIENGIPDWTIYDFRSFPAIQWKLVNVRRLKAQNPTKHEVMLYELENRFL